MQLPIKDCMQTFSPEQPTGTFVELFRRYSSWNVEIFRLEIFRFVQNTNIHQPVTIHTISILQCIHSMEIYNYYG
jgi:hypothetical protein